MVQESLVTPFLTAGLDNSSKYSLQRPNSRTIFTLIVATVIALACILAFSTSSHNRASLNTNGRFQGESGDIVEAEHGVVAADDEHCSDIGTNVLKEGGNAVDTAVATSLCLGVVHPMSSDIGGGSFMILRSSNGQSQAFDMRETAPQAASE